MSEDFEGRDHFLLVDGHALIYRAYHGFPELTDPTGQLINAVYGFTRILLTTIRDREPEYITVAFDHKEATFRHDAFEAYKANRSEMPEDLIPQIEIIKRVVTSLNIPQFELPGYEADDIVGALAHQAAEVSQEQVGSLILTGDKDLLQLVNDDTRVYIPARGRYGKDIVYNRDRVIKKMGVAPEFVPDLKGLMGDSSDNIPGVKGVGPKTALKLLTTFDTIEGVYSFLETHQDAEILKDSKNHGITPSVLIKLRKDKEQALLSKQLATISLDVPIKLKLENCRVRSYDKNKVLELFEEFEFNSLVGLLPQDSFEEALQDALF